MNNECTDDGGGGLDRRRGTRFSRNRVWCIDTRENRNWLSGGDRLCRHRCGRRGRESRLLPSRPLSINRSTIAVHLLKPKKYFVPTVYIIFLYLPGEVSVLLLSSFFISLVHSGHWSTNYILLLTISRWMQFDLFEFIRNKTLWPYKYTTSTITCNFQK